MASSRRNSFLKLNKSLQSQKPDQQTKLFDADDLDNAFDAEHNINNPFSTSQPSSSVNSKWLSINESWRKLQQIIENKQEKGNQNIKKQISVEFNSQELSNFSNDDLLNDISDCSIHEGEEIQEGDTSYVDYSDLNEGKDFKDLTKNSNTNLPTNNSSANNLQTTTTTINNTTNNTINNNLTTNSPSGNLSSSSSSSTITQAEAQFIYPSHSIVTTTTATATNITSSTSTPSIIKLDNHHNKKDDATKTHTFLFSKIKKNCSFERLNEFGDKESELFDNKNRLNNKEELIKSNDASGSNNFLNTTTKSRHHSQNQTNKTPTKLNSSKIKQMNKINSKVSFNDENNCGFSSADSSDKTNLFNRNKNQSNLNISANVDEPIPSLPYFMSFVVDLFRERFNFISFASSFCTFFILIFAIQLSPLSSFANGFILGLIFSILFLFIVIVYALNYAFQKIDYENDLHNRVLTGERWKKYPAYQKTLKSDNKLNNSNNQQQNSIHEGWFFELVYSKKLGVDRLTPAEKLDSEKMPETKLQLTYIKLEGTIIRLYVPKADQSKKIKSDMDPKVSFLKVSNKFVGHIYDFSKMQTKKIHLWLPKNIINKKKYLWSRKFPLILIIEETNKLAENKRTPFNLILFCRTNRDKEEWYNKFRQAIEIADQNLHLHHLSTTAASTPDEVTHDNEQENIPRTKSLDIGNISYEFEHLSNFLNYETFIQDLLSHNLYASGGNQNTSNQQTNNQQQNDSQNSSKDLFWFNTLVGRVFFDFLTHPHWTRWVQLKIQRKLSRIKLPYFIQTIVLKNVNLGTSLPKFLSVANTPVIDEKGIWIDFDLDYQGCFSMTLETKLDLMKLKENSKTERELKLIKSPSLNQATVSATAFDYDDLSDPESIVSLSDEDCEENLSIDNDVRQAKFIKLLDKLVVNNKYFQQVTDTKFLKKKMEDISNLPVQLTVNIYKLKGVLTINLPPAPTDRIWYGFRSIIDFELECKPSFGERSIQLGPIAQVLSKKLKQEFHKVLVLPNLDDIILGNVMMGNEDIEVLDEVP